ncbi:hypothetical protein B0H13DRAFT_2075735, partial [Mycena leptocephala]
LSGLLIIPHLASLIKDLRIVDDDSAPHKNTRQSPSSPGSETNFGRCTTASLDWDSMHRGLKTSLQSVFASPRLESIQLHGMLISAPPECALFHIFMDSHATSSIYLIDANHVIDILHGLSSSAMDYSDFGPHSIWIHRFRNRRTVNCHKGRNNSDTGLVGLKFLTNLRTIHFRTFCSFLHMSLRLWSGVAENASLEKVVLELFVHNAAYYQESDWTALAMAAKDLNKPVEVLLGEFGAKDPRPWRLEVCIAGCFTAAEEALAIPSSGLTIEQSTSHNYIPLAEIYDGW